MTALQPTIRRGNWTDLMASPVRIPAAEAFDTRRSLIFAHAGFIICMIFQRFGHMFGGSALFFSLPAFGLARTPALYVIGAVAACWSIQRVVVLFG